MDIDRGAPELESVLNKRNFDVFPSITCGVGPEAVIDTDLSMLGKSLARVMTGRLGLMVIVLEGSDDKLRSMIAWRRLPAPASALLVTVKEPPQDNAEKVIVLEKINMLKCFISFSSLFLIYK
jgi:hypothetical protein